MSDVLAYCVKCREKVPMVVTARLTLKDGRPALKGECSKCGCGIYRIETNLSVQAWRAKSETP